MDTKKLRQKILDLAIHGKLVPQDPNDEPASVLLERIKAEKEQLIKEGKIKRQKKSTSSDTSHYENDVPFEVPKGWVWCRLGDVFSHNTGKALNSSNKEGENLTYITTSNVYWDRFELNDLKKMPFTNSELEKCTVSKGDLLVCEGGDIGRSAIWNFDYDIRIQNHIHRLRPISEANVHFYYYVLMYNKQAGLIGGKGIGLMGLSSGELDKMIVPLPPIKEQCRITKEIEKLFAIVSLIEEDESDLKNAIQKAKSTILDLAISGRLTSHTSHYGKNEETLLETTLGNVCQLRDGEKITGKDYMNMDVKYLRGTKSGDMLHSGRFVPVGSLMILVDGENSGEVFTTPVDGYQGSTFKILDIDAKYCKEFILLLIQSNRKSLRENKVGSAIPHLNKKMFKEIVVPPFSYSEQCEIAQTVKDYFCVLDSIAG